MKRALARSTERMLVGILIFCALLILLAIVLPGIFPNAGSTINGVNFLKYAIFVLFSAAFIFSLILAIYTAAAYRSLTQKHKIMGFAPMILCFLGFLFFYFWYGGRIKTMILDLSAPQATHHIR